MRRRRGPAEIHRFPISARIGLDSFVGAAVPRELAEAVANAARAKGVEPGELVRAAIAWAVEQDGFSTPRIAILAASSGLPRPSAKKGRR